MRSGSITSPQGFEASAWRCAPSRDIFPFCLRWRMAAGRLARPQRQPARVEGLLDLLDRLAAEVRDRVQLRLRLLHEVSDRLHARPLQAVVRAHAQLEL